MKSHLHPQTRHSFHSRLPLTLGHRLASACALSLLLLFLLVSVPKAEVNYDTAWTFVYDGGRDSASGRVYWDKFFDVKCLPNGVCVCAGYTGYSNTQSLVMKLDNSGNILQKKTFDTDNAAGKYTTQSAHSIHIAKNGDFLVGGERGYDAWLMRLDSSGTMKWSTWYHDSIRDEPMLNRLATINSLLETPSGKIVCAAGDEFPNNGGYTLQNYAAYLAFDSTGKLTNRGQWDRETGYNIGGFSIAQSSNTRLQIAGNQGLYAIDTLGNAVSRRSYSFMLDQVGTVTNKVMRSKRLRDGRMVVIGQSYEPDCWTRYSRYSFDAWWSVVTLTGSSMEADWVRHGVSGKDDKIYDCTQLINGNLVFVGTKGGENGNASVWTIVTDSTGKNVLFEDLFVKVIHDHAVMYPMSITATPDSGFTVVGYGIVDTVSNWDAFAMHIVPKALTAAQNSKSAVALQPKKIAITFSGSQVRFALSENTAWVTNIEIFDARGATVAKLSKSAIDARSTMVWNAKNAAPGVYLYRLSGGQTVHCGTILMR